MAKTVVNFNKIKRKDCLTVEIVIIFCLNLILGAVLKQNLYRVFLFKLKHIFKLSMLGDIKVLILQLLIRKNISIVNIFLR